MGSIEQAVILFLDNPQLLKDFIDQKVDLVRHIKEKYYLLYAFLVKFAQNHPNLAEQAKTMTKDNILELLKTKKPEFYKIIMTHPGGKEWWASQDLSKFFSIL